VNHRFPAFHCVVVVVADRDGSQGSQGEGRGEREVYEGSRAGMQTFGLLFLTATVQLHVQGKTEQAQKDLARLAKIKAEREAALAKRKAEADGMVFPLVASISFVLVSPFPPAKAAEIEAKKAAGRR